MKIINILICLFFAFSNTTYAITDDDNVHMLPAPDGVFEVTSVDGRFVVSNELIVANDGVFAVDCETHTGVRVKSVNTAYSTIVPSRGTLVQYSKKYRKWYPCSVINGVYTEENFTQDIVKYNLKTD